MDKADCPRVQALAAQAGDHFFGAIHRVSRNRMALIGHMHPDLMGAACFKAKDKIGECAKRFTHAVMGNCFTGVFFSDTHFLSVTGVPADWRINRPLQLCKSTVNNGVINTCKAMFLYLFRKHTMGKIILCHDKQATGVLIDPVDNPWPDHTVDAGKSARAVVKQCVYKRPIPVARRGMNNHPFGFVDHQQIVVLIEDFHGNILR